MQDDLAGYGWLKHVHFGPPRLRRALRLGQPVGSANTTDPDALSGDRLWPRDRAIMRHNLLHRIVPNGYLEPASTATGHAFLEALVHYEGDADALLALRVAAANATVNADGRATLDNVNSDPLSIAHRLRDMNCAHRRGFAWAATNPNRGFDPTPGSWVAAGDRQIGWIASASAYDSATGRLFVNNSATQEIFYQNALLADQFLNFDAFVVPHASARTIAQMLVDHLIDTYAANFTTPPRSWNCLPFNTSGAGPSPEVAGFFVPSALKLWQDTDDSRYYDWALLNLFALLGASLSGDGWEGRLNEYVFGAENAEALLSGINWRTGQQV